MRDDIMKNKYKILGIFAFLIIVVIGYLYLNKKEYFKSSLEQNKTSDVDKEKKEAKELDLFGEYYEKAEQIVDEMSLEEKIGQLFLVRYDLSTVETEITTYYPGGYILFAKDFKDETKDSMLEQLQNHQKISKYPLIFGVDEEGGTVTRVSRYPNFRQEKFASPQQIYEQGGYNLLESTEKEKAELLLSIGINMNLAPVADVSVNKEDFIYNRSFGKNAEETAEYVKNMVQYANAAGISSTLKHFPGYGNNKDTHNGSSYDKRSYENFVNYDFLPFKSGIEAGVPSVLVSHNIVECMDPNFPASLSKNVVSELRNTLKFSGIVITDDLAMGAVDSYTQNGSAAVLAIKAGNDMIITSDLKKMYNEVLLNTKNNEIKEEIIDIAVKRIIAWKYAYGLM